MAPDGVMMEEEVTQAQETLEQAGVRLQEWLQQVPATETRVANHTTDDVNKQIARQIEANVYYYARHPDEIDGRLCELDAEWDVERTLEANWSVVSLASFGLALFSRRLGILGGAAAGFMLQHAIQGWCPPMPLMRRMGIRTTREINMERFALKTLRGDFQGVDPNSDPGRKAEQALYAVSLSAQQCSEPAPGV